MTNPQSHEDGILRRINSSSTLHSIFFDGEYRRARIMDVMDGRTCQAVLNVWGADSKTALSESMYRSMRVQRRGVSVPKIRARDAKERIDAIRVRNGFIMWLLPGHISINSVLSRKDIRQLFLVHPAIVWLLGCHVDKFGRYQCEFTHTAPTEDPPVSSS